MPFSRSLLFLGLVGLASAADRSLSLGNIRGEGIHLLSDADAEMMALDSSDPWALIGELIFGGVRLMHLPTGNVTQIVPTTNMTRMAIGVNFVNGYVLAAGGNGQAMYAYDASTGELASTCVADGAGFVNDLEIMDDMVYATDSFTNNLWFVPVEELGSDDCTMAALTLPEAEFLPSGDGDFRSNGIVAYADGLFIVAAGPGAVYHVSLANMTEQDGNLTATEMLPPGTVVSGDGLELYTDSTTGESILYVAQNNLENFNWINSFAVVVDVESGAVSLEQGDVITSDLFDSPSTVAVNEDFVWAVNARFGALGLPAVGETDPTTFAEMFAVIETKRVPAGNETTTNTTYAPSEAPVDATTASPTMTPAEVTSTGNAPELWGVMVTIAALVMAAMP